MNAAPHQKVESRALGSGQFLVSCLTHRMQPNGVLGRLMVGLKTPFSAGLCLLETPAFGALICYIRNATARLERSYEDSETGERERDPTELGLSAVPLRHQMRMKPFATL